MKDAIVVYHPADAVPLISQYGKKKQERFGVILLDSGHKVLKRKVLFVGCTGTCPVDLKVLFWEVCKGEAAAIIIFHNHPTGVLAPSEPDKELTKSVQEGCKTLGLQFLDHIIVGRYEYYSFLEHDILEMEETRLKEVAE